MKRIKISIHPAFFALLLFLYANLPGAAEILEICVVGVHDGHTVTLLMAGKQQVKIKLALMRLRAMKGFATNPMVRYVPLCRTTP